MREGLSPGAPHSPQPNPITASLSCRPRVLTAPPGLSTHRAASLKDGRAHVAGEASGGKPGLLLRQLLAAQRQLAVGLGEEREDKCFSGQGEGFPGAADPQLCPFWAHFLGGAREEGHREG